jgi:hypothetical protein
VPGMAENQYSLEVRDGRDALIEGAYKILGV